MRDATLSSVIDETQRAFDGYPYLVTRLVAAMHHIILLPRARHPEQLLEFGRRQARANRLPDGASL
ncbi:MAG: hypothetical protein HXY20_14865 [Acidobacteria bacterium]|nr:hypothetical protein [Acidobacteriota bacterium]